MRKFIITLIVLAYGISSCDYISEPIKPSNQNLGDTSTCTDPAFPVITTPVKKILIEDFTGHGCTNCPKAATMLHNIDSTNPGQIIGLAIHAGATFAAPHPSGASGQPTGSYSNDFRTSTGNDYDNFFLISAGGLPKGMINRLDYNATSFSHRKDWWTWGTIVSGIIGNSPTANLQIINDFDNGSKKVCSHIKGEFLTGTSGTFNLSVLLVQDSIVSWQFDNGVHDSDYVHRHVLRDALNGSWGDEIATGTISANDTFRTKLAYTIPNDINGIPTDPHHMYIVAFIYDVATYEVLQAEQAKVMP